MLKKAYIGSPGSGKTYKLLDDLKDLQIRQIFNKKSTLVMILKGEEHLYRRALPEKRYHRATLMQLLSIQLMWIKKHCKNSHSMMVLFQKIFCGLCRVQEKC